jgi:hypothetical protein
VAVGSVEHDRLAGKLGETAAWRRWGPYLAERAWGTVREDYSETGDAWGHLPHDLARSKAYRWGEDGLAGICDRYQILAFALAFWNGRDPILKERLFGVVPAEGNHGEDVKEYYFYLDSTPTHSYMKWLYKYPQREYPYAWLVDENQRRKGSGPEFELLDTGIFDDDRYFDVFVEYAKADPEDIAIRITVENRGPEPAELRVLPHLWFRNTWAWGASASAEPIVREGEPGEGFVALVADDRVSEPLRNLPFEYRLGSRYLYAPAGARALFTDNETNAPRVFGSWAKNRRPYVKDAFHRQLVNGEECVNREGIGTKACLDYRLSVRLGRAEAAAHEPSSQSAARRRRQCDRAPPDRGRRLLRRSPACLRQPGREARPAPGLRRDVVVEADLPFRREPVARGRQPAVAAARVALADPQHALAPSQLDARALDAR